MTRAYQRRGHPTMRQRILTLLSERQGRPLHYTRIAQQLGLRNARRVREACWQLWWQGRLAWYKDGVYQLPGHWYGLTSSHD
jgi:hypothetical protein